jgi:hypothetical protein
MNREGGYRDDERTLMKNKLLISTALLAAGIVLASCEKTPNGEPGAEAQRPNGSTTSERRQAGGEQGQTPGAPSGEPGAESQRPDGSTTSARQQGGGEQAQKRGAQEQGTPPQSSKAAERAGQPPTQGTAPINDEQQGKEGQHDQAVEPQNRNADQNQPNNGSQSAQARNENTKSKEQKAQSGEREEQKPGASTQSSGPLQQGQAPEPQQSQAHNEARQAQSAGSQQNEGGAAGGAVNLSRDQIRQAQIILKQKGFDVGDIDGKLGPRTRKALMAYQQQQGLQATGQMDQQTVTALGVVHGSGQQNTPGAGLTTGQGGTR